MNILCIYSAVTSFSSCNHILKLFKSELKVEYEIVRYLCTPIIYAHIVGIIRQSQELEKQREISQAHTKQRQTETPNHRSDKFSYSGFAIIYGGTITFSKPLLMTPFSHILPP